MEGCTEQCCLQLSSDLLSSHELITQQSGHDRMLARKTSSCYSYSPEQGSNACEVDTLDCTDISETYETYLASDKSHLLAV